MHLERFFLFSLLWSSGLASDSTNDDKKDSKLKENLPADPVRFEPASIALPLGAPATNSTNNDNNSRVTVEIRIRKLFEITEWSKTLSNMRKTVNNEVNRQVRLYSPRSDAAIKVGDLLSDHSIIIADPDKLRHIFSYLQIALKSTWKDINQDTKDVMFSFNLRFIEVLNTLNLCPHAPERFLSLDFASAKDVKLREAQVYATFLRHFMDSSYRSISLPAVYLLNAILQLDSLLHLLLTKGHTAAELMFIFEARKSLFLLSFKKSHYIAVCELFITPLSKKVRDAFFPEQNRLPPNIIMRTLEMIDRFLSEGAVPELRAYFYAKTMSTYLLTEDVVLLEFDSDEITYRQPYAAPGYSVWLADVLSFVHPTSPALLHSVLTKVVLSGNLKCIWNTVAYFSCDEWVKVFQTLNSEDTQTAMEVLNFNKMLLISFLKSLFLRDVSQIDYELPSFEECVQNKSHEGIYHLIVKTFTSLEAPDSEILHEFVSIISGDYEIDDDEEDGLNAAIIELYSKVIELLPSEIQEDENMLLGKITCLKPKDFMRARNSNNLLRPFVISESFDSLDSDDSLEEQTQDKDYSFSDSDLKFSAIKLANKKKAPAISKYTFLLPERTGKSFTITQRNGEIRFITEGSEPELFHAFQIRVLQIKAFRNVNRLYRKYYSITPEISTLLKSFDQIDVDITHEDSESRWKINTMRKADRLIQVITQNPLLLSSLAFQNSLKFIVTNFVACNHAPHIKTFTAAFLRFYFLENGIDVPTLFALFDSQTVGIQMFEKFLDSTPKKVLKSRLYYNCAYLMLLPYMKALNASEIGPSSIPSIKKIIKVFFFDKNIAPHYAHSMRVVVGRVINKFLSSQDYGILCDLFTSHWNKQILLESFNFLSTNDLSTIATSPNHLGILSLTASMSTFCKILIYDINPIPRYSHENLVFFLENGGLNDGELGLGYVNDFYGFLLDALAHSSAKVESIINRPSERMRYLFDTAMSDNDLEEIDLEELDLEMSTSHRDIIHNQINSLINLRNDQVISLLLKVLHHHYMKIQGMHERALEITEGSDEDFDELPEINSTSSVSGEPIIDVDFRSKLRESILSNSMIFVKSLYDTEARLRSFINTSSKSTNSKIPRPIEAAKITKSKNVPTDAKKADEAESIVEKNSSPRDKKKDKDAAPAKKDTPRKQQTQPANKDDQPFKKPESKSGKINAKYAPKLSKQEIPKKENESLAQSSEKKKQPKASAKPKPKKKEQSPSDEAKKSSNVSNKQDETQPIKSQKQSEINGQEKVSVPCKQEQSFKIPKQEARPKHQLEKMNSAAKVPAAFVKAQTAETSKKQESLKNLEKQAQNQTLSKPPQTLKQCQTPIKNNQLQEPKERTRPKQPQAQKKKNTAESRKQLKAQVPQKAQVQSSKTLPVKTPEVPLAKREQLVNKGELCSDIASYFHFNSNGISVPSGSLTSGNHELLLIHAFENGFPFLLNENFYNLLTSSNYETAKSAQRNMWIVAKKKVAQEKGILKKSRLELWKPKECSLFSVKGCRLARTISAVLQADEKLRDYLCSLVHYSSDVYWSDKHVSINCSISADEKSIIKVQNGALILHPSVTAENVKWVLSEFLSLKPVNLEDLIANNAVKLNLTQIDLPVEFEEKQPIVTPNLISVTENEKPSNEEIILEETAAEVNETEVKVATGELSELNLEEKEAGEDNKYMEYNVQQIVADQAKQKERILKLIDENTRQIEALHSGIYITESTVNRITKIRTEISRLEDMLARIGSENGNRKVQELYKLIQDTDLVALDFELTGVNFGERKKIKPSGFEDCKKSMKDNTIVQLGVMLMKRDKDGKPMQLNSADSVWKIPICHNDRTDDGIWVRKSKKFLIKNGFDLLKWKVQCMNYTEVQEIFCAIAEKTLITHNGLMDTLHLLKVLNFDHEIDYTRSTKDFQMYLDGKRLIIYDTKVLHQRTRNWTGRLEDIVKCLFPPEILNVGNKHDASFDAFQTGHVFRVAGPAIPEEANWFLETKFGAKSSSSSDSDSYCSSPSIGSLERDFMMQQELMMFNPHVDWSLQSSAPQEPFYDPHFYQGYYNYYNPYGGYMAFTHVPNNYSQMPLQDMARPSRNLYRHSSQAPSRMAPQMVQRNSSQMLLRQVPLNMASSLPPNVGSMIPPNMAVNQPSPNMATRTSSRLVSHESSQSLPRSTPIPKTQRCPGVETQNRPRLNHQDFPRLETQNSVIEQQSPYSPRSASHLPQNGTIPQPYGISQRAPNNNTEDRLIH